MPGGRPRQVSQSATPPLFLPAGAARRQLRRLEPRNRGLGVPAAPAVPDAPGQPPCTLAPQGPEPLPCPPQGAPASPLTQAPPREEGVNARPAGLAGAAQRRSPCSLAAPTPSRDVTLTSTPSGGPRRAPSPTPSAGPFPGWDPRAAPCPRGSESGALPAPCRGGGVLPGSSRTPLRVCTRRVWGAGRAEVGAERGGPAAPQEAPGWGSFPVPDAERGGNGRPTSPPLPGGGPPAALPCSPAASGDPPTRDGVGGCGRQKGPLLPVT